MDQTSRLKWQGKALIVQAPAKINLFLHITGRRSDGYHELESLFAFTQAGDVITIKPSDQISLDITGEFAEGLAAFSVTDNLIYQAAMVLINRYNITAGAAITLEKNLPISAGIGGGSADAAAALLGLIEFWGLSVSSDELDELALNLGADVPACLSTSPQWVTGIGEQRQAVSLGYPQHLLLVNPAVIVSTPSIFQAFKDSGVGFDFIQTNKGTILNDYNILDRVVNNSLQAPACQKEPIITEVIDSILNEQGCLISRMSGSGATCFGLFDSADSLNKAIEHIKKNHPSWWVYSDEIIRA